MGKTTISNVGKDVAEFLGLPDAKKYTGHCFRRTAATKLANAGLTALDMKRFLR